MGRLEHPGCVRGLGFGITPSGRSATNYSQFTSTLSTSRTQQRMLELETSHDELREQLAQSREELAKHREEVAQSEARHQAQMAKMMTLMRGMFEQLSQGMHDIGPSQIANKCYLAKHYFLQCIVM